MNISVGRRLAALGAALAMSATLAVPAQAQVNTGAFSSGGLDLFWSYVTGQVSNPAGGNAAWVIDPANQHPNWVEPTAGSSWITAEQGWEYDAPDDIWTTYFMTFSVADPTSFWLAGNWATDNNAVMLLNGVQTTTSSFTSFTSLDAFNLNDGFVAGTNTLAVQVYNGSGSGNPTGLLVSDLQSNVVPEPATLILLGSGLLGLGFVHRRRRQNELED